MNQLDALTVRETGTGDRATYGRALPHIGRVRRLIARTGIIDRASVNRTPEAITGALTQATIDGHCHGKATVKNG